MTDRLRFTEEMAKAGGNAAANYFATHDAQDEAEWLEVVFRAMLAAAPQEEYRRAFVRDYYRDGYHRRKEVKASRFAKWMASK